MMRIAIIQAQLFLHSLQLQLHYLQPRPNSFFRPRPNRFYVFTQLPSRPRHAPICSVMEEAEEEGWERILKTLKILD